MPCNKCFALCKKEVFLIFFICPWVFSVLFGKQVPECFVHTATHKNVLQEFQLMISRQIICSVLYIFNSKSPASVSITVWGYIEVLCVCQRELLVGALFSVCLSWDPPLGFAGNSAASTHANRNEFLTPSAVGCWTQVNSTLLVAWVNRQN